MTQPDRRHPHVVNLTEVATDTDEKGSRFGYACKELGMATAGRELGCSWYEVAPGRTAFPYHYHCAEEEAIFILEGEGTLRLGSDRIAVAAGDYIALPTGPELAHQLLNTGAGPLRYLCLSTVHRVEIVGYPDSNKIGTSAYAPGTDAAPAKRWVRQRFRAGASLDYYDGEDIGEVS